MSDLRVIEGGGEPPKARQCIAATKKGTRCRKKAVPGGEKCLTHMGVVKKSTLTKELADNLVTQLELGTLLSTALGIAGIPERTYYDWIAEGRTAEGDDTTLEERVARARATGEQANVDGLLKAAQEKDDWRAYAWLLARQNPEVYGQRQPTAARTPEGGADLGKPSDQAGL